MVFNLIDFLLGAKKPKGPVKPGTNPQNQQAPAQAQQAQGVQQNPVGQQQPAGSVQPQQDQQTPAPVQAVQPVPAQGDQPSFQDSGSDQSATGPQGQRVKVSEVIGKIQDEAKTSSEKLSTLLSDMKSMENSVNTLSHRVDDLEESKKVTDQKLSDMDSNMTKFLSLYELINNQYNPFVDKSETPIINEDPKKIVLDAQGNAMPSSQESVEYSDVSSSLHKTTVDVSAPVGGSNPSVSSVARSSNDFDAAILELDTLDIQEAAADAVPLTRLKTNTNSLVTILSWLEYLIRKVGIDETRNTLRYYTEVLRWITPEVFFDLDKYLKGMTDKKNVSPDDRLSVKDHIVSLYFISKLNEKALDEKLTRAVLQIIKQ